MMTTDRLIGLHTVQVDCNCNCNCNCDSSGTFSQPGLLLVN